MASIKPNCFIQIYSLILVLLLACTMLSPVYATESIESLEQSSSNLENELTDLENELEILSNDISSIAKQITTISEEIKLTKEELALAKGQEEIQYDAMKKRIRYMYENGNHSLLEMLFSSSSLAEFLKRAEFCSAISEYDQAQLQRLVETQESISKKENTLAAEQEKLYQLQEELNQKEEALSNQISSTASELTSITNQLAAAREEAKKVQDELNEEVVPVIPPKEEPALPPQQDDNNVTSSDNNSDKDNDSDKNNSSDKNDDSDKNNSSDNSAAVLDIELFAALIECEAGSTDYEGMLAVASVVVNRMNHSSYPDTIRGVIYQAGQFPPAHDGKVDHVLKRGVKSSCVQAATDALAGKNNVGDCLNFRSANSGHVGTIIGNNVFF